MTDKIIDFESKLQAKLSAVEASAEKYEAIGKRQRIIFGVLKEMREFSTDEEIARTLRFAADVLEGKDG